MTRRVLTIGHSYAVGVNRAAANAMARVPGWTVTIAAPDRVATDRGLVAAQPVAPGGARVVTIPVRRPGRVHWMAYGRELRGLLAEKWDVVHCWQEPFVWSAGQVARWAPAGAKVVLSTFQNLPKRYPPPFSLIERAALARADGWIAFGETVAATLAARPGYRDRPMRIIPPAIDLTRFRPDAAARASLLDRLGWVDDGSVLVGYAGRLVEEKGIRPLMAALERTPGCRAVFFGDGPMGRVTAEWVARRSARAALVPGAGHEEMPALLAALDLLVLPSLTTRRWREQFGRVLAEAMACGVPVVGSDSGEIPHVVGDAGLVVAEDDAAALAAALGRLSGDAALRAALGERALARAHTLYAPEAVAAQHLAFFESLLDGEERGAA